MLVERAENQKKNQKFSIWYQTAYTSPLNEKL